MVIILHFQFLVLILGQVTNMAGYVDIIPGPEEKLLVCGQSGAGKTWLIKKLLSLLNNELIIILDSKPDWDKLEPMFSRDKTGKPRKLEMKWLWILDSPDAKGIYVYQTNPDIPAYADNNVDRLIFWALRRFDRLKKRKGLTVVIDELGDFAKGTYTIPSVSRLLRQGRSKQIRTIMGSQRPSGIPQLAVDQSQRFAVFMLMNEMDRKKLARWIHPGLMQMAHNRDFWYYEVRREEEPKPLTLMHQEIKKKNEDKKAN